VPGIRRMLGNSLAAYPTARTVLRGGSGGNVASLPDAAVVSGLDLTSCGTLS
jgi:hypothetical protein